MSRCNASLLRRDPDGFYPHVNPIAEKEHFRESDAMQFFADMPGVHADFMRVGQLPDTVGDECAQVPCAYRTIPERFAHLDAAGARRFEP